MVKAQIFSFRRESDKSQFLIAGWSAPEEEFTWSVAPKCSIRLPIRSTKSSILLTIDLSVFVAPPMLCKQRVDVNINGRFYGYELLTGDTVLSYHLDSGNLTGDGILVDFGLPMSTSPAALNISADSRRLGIAIRSICIRPTIPMQPSVSIGKAPLTFQPTSDLFDMANTITRGVTGLPLTDLAMSYESLGLNCEFGLFQRRCNAEPLGLLRFSSISLRNLLIGIERKFDNLENFAGLSAHVEGASPEWMVYVKAYGIAYHTFQSPEDVNCGDLLLRQPRILQFRREKLLELITSGEKLFVLKRPEGLSTAQVLGTFRMLRLHGPCNLLYVDQGSSLPAGAVNVIEQGLFVGSMRGVDPVGKPEETFGRNTWLSDEAFRAWVVVCSTAYRLWRNS